MKYDLMDDEIHPGDEVLETLAGELLYENVRAFQTSGQIRQLLKALGRPVPLALTYNQIVDLRIEFGEMEPEEFEQQILANSTFFVVDDDSWLEDVRYERRKENEL